MKPLDHPIGLWVVSRRGAVLNAQQLVELLPKVGRELGPPVRSEVDGNAKPRDPVPNESSCTCLCPGIWDRNSFWPTGEPVNYCEEVGHPLADWKRPDEVDVQGREARSRRYRRDERGACVSVDF